MITEKSILDKFDRKQIFENRTYKYLSPTLRGHGENFTKRFTTLCHKVAYGIFDTLFAGSHLIEESSKRPIFILVAMEVNPNNLEKFLTWVKFEPYYITDYVFDTDLENPKLRMLVLDCPEVYYEAYDQFKLGNYSKMFTPEECEKLFGNRGKEDILAVLTKNPKIKTTFVKEINRRFNEDVEVSSFYPEEFDFPYKLDKKAEIFNPKYL